MNAARWTGLLVLVSGLLSAPQAGRSQFVDPLECLPPAGQGL